MLISYVLERGEGLLQCIRNEIINFDFEFIDFPLFEIIFRGEKLRLVPPFLLFISRLELLIDSLPILGQISRRLHRNVRELGLRSVQMMQLLSSQKTKAICSHFQKR